MRIKIATVGEVVLRTKARPLTTDEIQSAATQELIEHMKETLRDAPGVGMAAPQIGLPLQLAVIEDKAEYQSALSETELAERERRFHFTSLLTRDFICFRRPRSPFLKAVLASPGLPQSCRVPAA